MTDETLHAVNPRICGQDIFNKNRQKPAGVRTAVDLFRAGRAVIDRVEIMFAGSKPKISKFDEQSSCNLLQDLHWERK